MMKDKSKNFKIILEYIKDLSIETPSVEALSFVRKDISNYVMDIDINSSLLKNKALEITTKLTLQDKKGNNEKSWIVSCSYSSSNNYCQKSSSYSCIIYRYFTGRISSNYISE